MAAIKGTIRALSPTSIEQFLLCESRAFGRLNLLGEDEWEEEHGEGAAMGTLAHAAAKIWFRPNAVWLTHIAANKDHELLAKEAMAMTAKAGADREALNKAEDEIAKLGLLKHPYTDPGHVYRMAIADVANGPYGCELVTQGRILFDQILAHYNRETLNVVFAERRYKGTLANGVPIHTILDLAVDRGDGRLELIDYKTGFITMTTEEMYAKHQVRMNLLAVARYDPTLQRFTQKSFTYFWVRPGYETGPVSFSAEQIMDYEHYLASLYRHATTLTEPAESINRFCWSCARKLNCKAFRLMVSDGLNTDKVLEPEEIAKLSDDEVMRHHYRLKTQINLLDKSRANLAEYLLNKLKARNATQIMGEGMKATFRQNKSASYDVSTVLMICAHHKVDPSTVVGVTKKKVEETFSGNLDAMRVLALSMKRGANAPFVDVSPLSKQDLKEREKTEQSRKPA